MIHGRKPFAINPFRDACFRQVKLSGKSGLAPTPFPCRLVHGQVKALGEFSKGTLVVHVIRMPNHQKSISLDLKARLTLTNQTESWILKAMNANPIMIAVQRAGSRAGLARALGVSDTAVKKWELAWEAGNIRAVPAHRAVEIEQATGLPRYLFRPDLWEVTEGTTNVSQSGKTARAA